MLAHYRSDPVLIVSTIAHRARTKIAFIAAAAFGISACTTFEVHHAYMPSEAAKNYLSFNSDDAHVTVQFVPSPQYELAGFLGVPAIPTYARIKPESTMVLEVSLRLQAETTFSFAASPCLRTTDTVVCPLQTQLSAQLNSGDTKSKDAKGNRTYGQIAEFSPFKKRMTPILNKEDQRITSAELFDYYGYRGDPKWVTGVIYVRYIFPCSPTCPTEFSLVIDDIVKTNNGLRSTGFYHFKKTKVRSYAVFRGLG